MYIEEEIVVITIKANVTEYSLKDTSNFSVVSFVRDQLL